MTDPLTARLARFRTWGALRFETAARDDPEGEQPEAIRFELDRWVAALGLHPIGENWREIDEPAARKILRRILTEDLATTEQHAPVGKARALATAVLADCGEHRRFFTNGTFELEHELLDSGRPTGPIWTALGPTDYDTGLVVVSPNRLTLLWVFD